MASPVLELRLDSTGICAIAGCYSLLRGWAVEREEQERPGGDQLAALGGTDGDTSADHGGAGRLAGPSGL